MWVTGWAGGKLGERVQTSVRARVSVRVCRWGIHRDAPDTGSVPDCTRASTSRATRASSVCSRRVRPTWSDVARISSISAALTPQSDGSCAMHVSTARSQEAQSG